MTGAAELDPTVHVLKPGRVVAVFTDDGSGATLGYFGRIVELDQRSVGRNNRRAVPAASPTIVNSAPLHRRHRAPLVPAYSAWKYVVYIPWLNATYRIRADYLVPTDQSVSPDTPLGPACELRFDRQPAADNHSLSGSYRLAGTFTWNRFHFVTTDAASPSYQVSMPVSLEGDRACRLRYAVPSGDVLDREYVVRALGEICGATNLRILVP